MQLLLGRGLCRNVPGADLSHLIPGTISLLRLSPPLILT